MADTVEIQDPYTLSELRTILKEVFDRGGDSSLSDSLANHYLNAAETFIVKRIGNPSFLQKEDTISVSAETYTFPANVNKVIQMVDQTNVRVLTRVDRFQWNSYITKPSYSTGTPVAWTQYGFNRRTNTESPSSEVGGIQVKFWPVPTSAVTLYVDYQLKPGTMILDSDFSVLPSDYHYGLIEVALMLMGPYDIGQKAYAQHRDAANMWLAEIVHDERREPGGNNRFIPDSTHGLRSNFSTLPLTRRGQLYGGKL